MDGGLQVNPREDNMTEDERQDLISDCKTTFTKTGAGANVLQFISDFCLEHAQTFIVNSERKSCFNEGARSVILKIRELLADKGEPRQTEVVTVEDKDKEI